MAIGHFFAICALLWACLWGPATFSQYTLGIAPPRRHSTSASVNGAEHVHAPSFINKTDKASVPQLLFPAQPQDKLNPASDSTTKRYYLTIDDNTFEVPRDFYERIHPPANNTMTRFYDYVMDWYDSLSPGYIAVGEDGVHTLPFYAIPFGVFSVCTELFWLYCWFVNVRFVRMCQAIHVCCPNLHGENDSVSHSRCQRFMVALGSHGGQLVHTLSVAGVAIMVFLCTFRPHPTMPQEVNNLARLVGVIGSLKDKGQDILNYEHLRSGFFRVLVPVGAVILVKLGDIVEYLFGLNCKCCCARKAAKVDGASASTDANCAPPALLPIAVPQPSAPVLEQTEGKSADTFGTNSQVGRPELPREGSMFMPLFARKSSSSIDTFEFDTVFEDAEGRIEGSPMKKMIRDRSRDLYLNRDAQQRLLQLREVEGHQPHLGFVRS